MLHSFNTFVFAFYVFLFMKFNTLEQKKKDVSNITQAQSVMLCYFVPNAQYQTKRIIMEIRFCFWMHFKFPFRSPFIHLIFIYTYDDLMEVEWASGSIINMHFICLSHMYSRAWCVSSAFVTCCIQFISVNIHCVCVVRTAELSKKSYFFLL